MGEEAGRVRGARSPSGVRTPGWPVAQGIVPAAQVAEFNAAAIGLYDDGGRNAGGITAEDRQGISRFFAFTSLSIGALRVKSGQFRSAELVANAAARAKHSAKMAGVGLFVSQAADVS